MPAGVEGQLKGGFWFRPLGRVGIYPIPTLRPFYGLNLP